jgi:uncharacterized membrane protein
MTTSFDILVIILSVTLFIFLVLAIVCTVLVLKLVTALRAIAAKGEHLVDTAEEIGETFKRNAGAVGLLKVLMNAITTINKARK